MSLRPKIIYEFDYYRLDVAERQLLRGDEAVPLQPKIFDLLCVLVGHQGHLLEKDELMQLVWPDVIVTEANLANNISILRKTLCANGERFIETVPKRGYRFIVPVRQVEKPNSTRNKLDDSSAERPPNISRQRNRLGWWKWRKALAIMLLILLLVGMVVTISYALEYIPD
jgi:DNA-binding winged helix-turn-helix (wHTH) protein